MLNSTQLAVGIDAGSSKTRCLIASLERGMTVRYLGHGTAPAKGWSRGRLTDYNAVRDTIHAAVKTAESRAGVSVDAAVAGLGGNAVEGFNHRGIYEFGRPNQVTDRDMAYAAELGGQVHLPEGRMVLQVLPQDFTVDGRAGYRDPRPFTCSRLEANVHVISADVNDHEALVTAMHQAHLAVEETISEAMAAAYACIVEEDRRRGVALIDIGAHTTDYVIYDGDALLRAGSAAVGGEHFTRDVAHALTVSYEDAELLKREYGSAVAGLELNTALVEVPSAPGRPAREAPRRMLNTVLQARAEDIFEFLRCEIEAAGMERSLLEGVVLTGGGACLPGMCDIAEDKLGCQARNGLIAGLSGLPEEINDPSWAVAAGLAMYSARLKTRKDYKKTIPGIKGLVLK